MLFNTTYQVDLEEARNFVIWLHECYIPQVEEQGSLSHPRIARVLSHREQDSECFALEFEVENTAALHHWYNKYGMDFEKEIRKMFGKKVVWFSTLLEVIE